jgi:hypothetical protein
VKLNCDEHSDYKYLGDLSDDDIKKFFIDIKNDIDVNKNIRLLKYYGYLNLFVINKK